MSALEESLEFQGLPEWEHPSESFAVRSGMMTEGEVMAEVFPEGGRVTTAQTWSSNSFDKGLTVLVTGSRDWVSEDVIHSWLDLIDRESRIDLLIHGDCPTGADNMADRWVRRNGINVDRRPADWRRYGKSAGFVRNDEMIKLEPDVVLAFQRNGSKGTQHTIDLARKRGIEVILEAE